MTTKTEQTGPIDLFTSFLHLGQDGHAQPVRQAFDPGQGNWQLMAFHVETDADVHGDHWEIHTEADEIVSCLSGGFRLILRPEQRDAAEQEFTLTPGTAVVVPRGRWHRLTLDAPSDLMSLTVPRGTRLEKRD